MRQFVAFTGRPQLASDLGMSAATIFLLQWVAVALLLALQPPRAWACDMCSIYSSVQLRDATTGFYSGVAQQFSHFGRLQLAGEKTDNPHNERMESSITQIVVGYSPIEPVALQLNLPVISRHYRRLENGRPRRGDETGIGDLTALMRYRPLSIDFEEGALRLAVLAGVEVPSGDSDPLGEDGEESSHSHGARPRHDEHERPSGIHGHDITLGSGSLDTVFGADLIWFWQRWYTSGFVQYRQRNEGAFDYEYADELSASLAPGVFLYAEHGMTFAMGGAVTAETKGKDRVGGEVENDTAMTALYAGPTAQFSWHRGLTLELAGDLPAIRNNSGLQIVPSYRIRAAAVWRF
ncbi:MAG TPA: hypothetical protein VEB21_09385 [Terriglobales bacterium]|nr:hypothetical protein [Terriglobales bacterium]